MDFELRRKIAEAKTHERFEKKPFYVVWNAQTMRYELSDRAPFFGEFYTSDGIQHGPSHHVRGNDRSEKFNSDL